jgi:2-polyprenyl-6-methoxyphenol hydroxylase-like FAD-dependent oxidoreductase
MDTVDRAVVVGGSIAGLAAAAVLSSRAREVVVVERRTPENGSVSPQGHLPHVLLASGGRVLEDLFPGFSSRLIADGAYDGGTGTEMRAYWPAAGVLRDHVRLPDLGVPRALCSRGLLESRLRTEVQALPAVRLVEGNVAALVVGDGRVRGARLAGRDGELEADVVVDATGRGGRSPAWLRDAGLPAPGTSEVVVDLRYTAFTVERRPDDFAGAAFAVVQNTATVPRIGVALPREGDQWQVVLGGYFGVAAPPEAAGAADFARGLADPALAPLLGRPWLSAPARHTFRSSLRRHWDRLHPLPSGLCVVGDAVASFNPIYGQGMAAALLQAEALGAAIDRHGAGHAHAAAREVARVADAPWTTATGGDLVYEATVGERPRGSALVNGYVDRVMRASAVDEVVNAAWTEVQQLLAPPSRLFHPRVVARALRRGGAPTSATDVRRDVPGALAA